MNIDLNEKVEYSEKTISILNEIEFKYGKFHTNTIDSKLYHEYDLANYLIQKKYHELFMKTKDLFLLSDCKLPVDVKIGLIVETFLKNSGYYNVSLLLEFIVDFSIMIEPVWAIKLLFSAKHLGEVDLSNQLLIVSAISLHLMALNEMKTADDLIYQYFSIVNKVYGLKTTSLALFYYVNYCIQKQKGNHARVSEYILCYFRNEKNKFRFDLKTIVEDLYRACLLDESNYNLIEILQHPILQLPEIKDQEKFLLRDLLLIVNSGNYKLLCQYIDANLQEFNEKNLLDHIKDIKIKCKAFVLLHLAFVKPHKNRILTFEEIAEAINIDLSEVEPTMIKLFSKEILTGRIDSLTREIVIFTLQPKLLDEKLIITLIEQLKVWSQTMKTTAAEMRSSEPFLFA